MRHGWLVVALAACAPSEEYPCGNGEIDPGEQCDDGNDEDFDDACGFCKVREAACGDGTLQPWVEACDPARDIGGLCRADCARPSCGDGAYTPGDVCFDDGEDLVELELPYVRMELADLDRDGALDIVIARGNPATIEVLFNDASGFSRLSVPLPEGSASYVAMAIGDVDADQDIDLAVAYADRLVIVRNQGARQLAAGSPITIEAGSPDDVELGDFDGDGDVDFMTANTETVSLLRAGTLPLGTLQDSVDVAATQLARGDFDGDGVLDVVAIEGSLSFLFVPSTGAPVVEAAGTIAMHTSGLFVADLNHDDRLDLIVGAADGQSAIRTRVMIARPDRTSFDSIDLPLSSAGAPIDVDGDGHLDLTSLVNEGDWLEGQPMWWSTQTLLGAGDGTFGSIPLEVYLGPGSGSCLLCDGNSFRGVRGGDLDGDGAIDLVTLSGQEAFLFGGFQMRAIRIQRGIP